MILYGLFFVLLSAFYMSAVSILRLAFDLFRVPVGVRSVAIAAGLLLICFPLIRKQSGAAALREVLAYALAWIPWLLYAALRTDFADSYAALLFGKMVVINFVSAVTVTVAYRVDPAAFGKFFFPVSVLFGIALLAEVLINPQVFIYATTIERLTIENANPIWLSRSFATAAVCVVFLSIRNRLIKLVGFSVFVVAMIPTGSRAPLLSLTIVSLIYVLALYRSRPNFVLRIVVVGAVVTISLVVVGPQV